VSPWWDKLGGNGERARPTDTRRRSVYEHRDPIAFAGDPDEPEAGWRRIGKLDPRSGAWVDGPHWHQPQRPWWMGR
jgi:hypothetical protein